MDGESRSSSFLMTIGVGAAVLGLTVVTPLATVAAPVVVAALVVESSSNHQSGAGIAGVLQEISILPALLWWTALT